METDQQAKPRGCPMIWAVRAVPVLLIFCALDLLQPNPPVSFLVLTLVRVALGVLTLVAIHKQRRDRIALAYVVVVFASSLANPERGQQILTLSTLGLVVIGVDLLRQRHRAASSDETRKQELDETRAE